MDSDVLRDSVVVPPGGWAVGVSGGADSVALLLLLRGREGVGVHVVHLDHLTRGEASAGDARFVGELASRLGVAATIARRDEIEAGMTGLPGNVSARYRAVRMELFRRVVEREKLRGVILAHQADDQAETVLLRLLRGSGPAGLAGMLPRRMVGGLTILRPLLGVRRSELREYLRGQGQLWREDASNESDAYARNRVRKWLTAHGEMHEPLVELGRACERYRRWGGAEAVELGDEFAAVKLANQPRMAGRESARRWLMRQGSPGGELTAAVLDRLRLMAGDAATGGHQQFPGGLSVRRRSGWIRRQGSSGAG